ncbi:MAG: hypothetical protein JW795_04660 [Chitinivibrionales bacterium]|nr:hypothetical protein [Chitinivibrionales bacterium]
MKKRDRRYCGAGKVAVRTLLAWLCMVPGIALIAGCSGGSIANSEAGNTTVINTTGLIRMPSSLATESGSIPFMPFFTDKSDTLHSLVRRQNYFVNQLITGPGVSVAWMIDSFVSPLPWKKIIAGSPFDTTIGSVVVCGTFQSGDSLPYCVKLTNGEAGGRLAAALRFNASSQSPQGRIVYFVESPSQPGTDSMVVDVHFWRNQTQRFLTVDMTRRLTSQVRAMAQKLRFSLSQRDAIIQLSASVYFPFLDSLLVDTVGHCYTYTALADSAANRSVITIGIPPAIGTDTARIFTDYGIATVLSGAFIHYQIPKLPDTLKRILVTSYKDTLSIPIILWKMVNDPAFTLHNSDEIVSMASADLKLFLFLNSGIVDPQIQKDFTALLWLLKLRQPLYFNAAGYVGNGPEVPHAFQLLVATPVSRALFVPALVKQLVIPLNMN